MAKIWLDALFKGLFTRSESERESEKDQRTSKRDQGKIANIK